MLPEPMSFVLGGKRDLNVSRKCTSLGLHRSCKVFSAFTLAFNCILHVEIRITFVFSYWFFPKAFGPFHALLSSAKPGVGIT